MDADALDLLNLEETSAGVLLPVRAQPRAKRNAIAGLHAGRLKVAVTAARERGKANEALLHVLAESLGVRRSQVTLVSGDSAREKLFQIRGVSAAEIRSRLRQHPGMSSTRSARRASGP